MRKSILIALLSSVALPAMAADLPVKAPLRPEAIIDDWSGIYTGVAAGFAWGREKLSNDVSTFDTATASSQLFGTSTARIFNGTAAIIQPPFSMSDCLITNCNRVKMNGFMAGGFAGAQKQLGNWVIGIEGSWDWTGMKKSHSASEDSVENVTRFVPTTTFTTADTPVTVPGQLASVIATAFIPDRPLAVTGLIPAGQPVTFTIPAGTINSGGTTTLAAGTVVTINAINGVTLATPQTVTLGAAVTGTAAVQNNNTATFIGFASTAAAIPISATGTLASFNASVFGTAAVQNVQIVVPGQSITIPLPRETTVRALVTRTADLETKIDQIADVRGKFGLTNVFFGPNVLLYGTGGFAVGHFNKSLSISQTTALCTTQVGACVTTGQASRTDTFSATSGDTRLGWVVGAGIDWKLGPNFVLGALYRHHEFPKGTVSFSEGTNSLGFGTTRASVDSIQGRLSWLFPIH